MFVEKLKEENPGFLKTLIKLHQQGKILPDSYVIDLDQLLKNAKIILDEAEKKGIKLFFMLKQIGRNPEIAKELVRLGYTGAVVVDFKEARVMMNHRIPIGNIGHLVQIPEAMMNEVVAYGPEVITIYSMEKCRSINYAAEQLHKVQKILIRVFDDTDMIYSGQTAGIHLKELPSFLERIKELPGILVAGVTSFPCFLYDEAADKVTETPNLKTVQKAVEICKACGVEIKMINAPSTTCVETLALMKQAGVNYGEPGHGFTATTPAHRKKEMAEKSCIAYLSEISHNFQGKAYCYGGGYYRRSHAENALVGTSLENCRMMKLEPVSMENIDYHFGLNQEARVGETVIMAFRFQIFVTRSDVVLVKGAATDKPEIIGVYDSLGNKKWGALL